MYFTGFADEAGADLDIQIKASKELGWSNIETRALMGSNLAYISDEEFELVSSKLDEAGITFNSFGSGVGNWATSISESPEKSYEEIRKAIPRMQKLGIKMIRIMSFPVTQMDRYEDFADEAFKRLKTITKIAEDGGIICVLENCSGWASGSWEHTLRAVDAVNSPNFKLVFDTGNPVFDPDVRMGPPYKKQNALEFYNAVKEHIIYIHIKDGYMKDDKCIFTFPGEGDGYVKEILKDLLKNGYDGGISIEPHMALVFHDKSITSNADIMYTNYIEYGKRTMKIIEGLKREL